jgi:hypothetical protein
MKQNSFLKPFDLIRKLKGSAVPKNQLKRLYLTINCLSDFHLIQP